MLILEHADGEAADDIDEGDDDAGDGVAADELAGTVHGAVEFGLLGELRRRARASFSSINAGVQIGIDAHLLAGHGIQGEAGGHFGDAAGALGDDHEIDDHQDAEIRSIRPRSCRRPRNRRTP